MERPVGQLGCPAQPEDIHQRKCVMSMCSGKKEIEKEKLQHLQDMIKSIKSKK